MANCVRNFKVPVGNAVVNENRSRWCRMCRTALTVKSIWCACWITVQILTYACWSLRSSWWWKGHCVFIVRSNGGSTTAILRQLISGCLCLGAQRDCFNKGLILLAILLKLMRYTHLQTVMHVTLAPFDTLMWFSIYLATFFLIGFKIIFRFAIVPSYI